MLIALNTKMHKDTSIIKFQQGRNALNRVVTWLYQISRGKLLKFER